MSDDPTASTPAAPPSDAVGRTAALVVVAATVVLLALLLIDPPLARPLAVAAGLVVLAAALVRPASLRRGRVALASDPAPALDRAALDRAAAENAARSRVLAMASHEIRTPLNGILGMADLLARTPLSPEQSAYVGAIHGSGAALLDLVDGMLDLTRLEAGRLDPAPQPIGLNDLVEEVVELLAPRAQAKGLELAGFVAPALPGRVSVDPVLLRQILLNLAGNAVKFTERGGVALEVEPGTAGRIAFRVRDTGIGIAPEDAERIFAEFERAGRGAERAPGTGLGLAIARALVERMGGTIRLDSRLGAGSTFVVELACPALAEAPAPAAPLGGRRVLVVSDGVIEPPLLARRLHGLGAEVVLCADPDRVDPELACDVALIDHRDGADAADRRARLRDRGVVLGSAVVLIAPAARSSLDRLRGAGFAGHLVKPVRDASLARLAAAPPAAVGTASAPPPVRDVLLVDDNPVNALLGRALVEHLGHRVRVVGDGAAALEAIEAARRLGRPPEVVLMDLHMPGMDGFTAIRALRAAAPAEEPRIRVIALTADATPAAATRALAAGADAALVKPIERERLAALLDDPAEPGRADRAG